MKHLRRFIDKESFQRKNNRRIDGSVVLTTGAF
jgi:hypothetical protein